MHESLRLSILNLYLRYEAWVHSTRNPSERYGGLLRTTNHISWYHDQDRSSEMFFSNKGKFDYFFLYFNVCLLVSAFRRLLHLGKSTSLLILIWNGPTVKVSCSSNIAILVHQALKMLQICKSHKNYNCLFQYSYTHYCSVSL